MLIIERLANRSSTPNQPLPDTSPQVSASCQADNTHQNTNPGPTTPLDHAHTQLSYSGGTRRNIQGYPKFFYDTFIEQNLFLPALRGGADLENSSALGEPKKGP
ncbi:hypothetical protein HanIR_Chr06g0284971 [Helianthus annuus]|nr:hypothetical protein HanIR_Chr06g0284971 [Helianthus annuus]